MTPTLELDLRLLDLLASLPQMTDEPPTAEALRARLGEVAQAQGLHPSAAEIEHTVTHYLAQQATDARLLALLQEGLSSRSDSVEALRQRLEHRRVEANVPATPEGIQRAIAIYKAQTTPFSLWARPTTELERQEALRMYRTRTRKNDDRFGFIGVPSLFSFMFGALGAVAGGGEHSDTLLGWGLGLMFVGMFGGSIGLMVAEGIRATATTPWTYRKWFGVPAYESLPLTRMADLENAPPDLDRMQRWLSNEQARDALKQLSKTLVPITRQDAAYLDHYVNQVKAQKEKQARQEAQQAWKEGLDQLRQS